MSHEIWSAVDDYICDRLLRTDSMLENTLRNTEEAGLPQISVSPCQGKLLQLLAQMKGARRILEIGTLGGYSSIWLARALPKDGLLITLEVIPAHAEIAKTNIAQAGLSSMVEIRVGNALETLPLLEKEGMAPFDFIFIDADKPGYPEYLEWSLRLSRPGSVIICDNVVRGGAVADPGNDDPKVVGVRHLFDLMAGNPRLSATAIQTVGSKGYDGFSLAIVAA